MKGATAVPWVRTIKPPKITIMTRIGNSQYFLRSRMNAMSSARKAIVRILELTFHRGRCWTGLRTRDPVTPSRRRRFQPQGILARQTHQYRDRSDRQKEQQAHDQRIDGVMQQQAEFEPDAVHGAQQLRGKQGGCQKE